MFTSQDFDALTKEGKVAYVAAHGVLVSERTEDKYSIHVHQLHSFYVEMWYDLDSGCYPDIIKSFSNTDYTLYQFNALSQNEQAEYTWTKGEHIDDRMEVGYHILLFQCPAFYVEIWYHPAAHRIERIRSFSNTECLQPYLDKISITDLNILP